MTRKPLVSIVSAGLSKFGKREGLYGRELFAEAAKEAFERCPNLEPKKDIKALFVGHIVRFLRRAASDAYITLDNFK